MKQRNSGYIAIGANINKLQHVQSADNFVKKWDSIFTMALFFCNAFRIIYDTS